MLKVFIKDMTPCNNILSCRYGKIYFTNASSVTVKCGTRRAKPVGSALGFGLFCPLAMSCCFDHFNCIYM